MSEQNSEDQDQLLAELEAILMVVEEPVTVAQLAIATGENDHGVLLEQLRRLQADYDGNPDGTTDAPKSRRRGFELREIAGGWRIYARAEHSPVLEKFMVQGAKTKLSQAAAEALAIIAYLQPTTRSRIAQIRGVNSDSVVKSLHARGLIEDVGQEEFSQAVLYSTTPHFLELLGLDSIDQLPKLSPMLPGVADLEGLTELNESANP